MQHLQIFSCHPVGFGVESCGAQGLPVAAQVELHVLRMRQALFTALSGNI